MSPMFFLGHNLGLVAIELEALRKDQSFSFLFFSLLFFFSVCVCMCVWFLFVCGFFERQRIWNVTGALLSIVAYHCSCY